MTEPLWIFLKKLGLKLPYDPTISLLGLCPEKPITQKDTHIQKDTINRIWKQPRCPLTGEWIKKFIQWNIYNIPQSVRRTDLS